MSRRFDFSHLQAVHRHLFGDLCEWAGEIRSVDTVPGDLGILRDPSAAIPDELERVFAGNFACVDGGIILADVLWSAIKPVSEVSPESIAVTPREGSMSSRDHWESMIEHHDTTSEQTYSWVPIENRCCTT